MHSEICLPCDSKSDQIDNEKWSLQIQPFLSHGQSFSADFLVGNNLHVFSFAEHIWLLSLNLFVAIKRNKRLMVAVTDGLFPWCPVGIEPGALYMLGAVLLSYFPYSRLFWESLAITQGDLTLWCSHLSLSSAMIADMYYHTLWFPRFFFKKRFIFLFFRSWFVTCTMMFIIQSTTVSILLIM